MRLDRKNLEDTSIVVIVILVGVGGFGLGKLSSNEKRGIKNNSVDSSSYSASLLPQFEEEARDQNERTDPIEVIGSKNSDKYHYPWCPGFKQISDANKVVFASKEDAEKAGYTKASNCKEI